MKKNIENVFEITENVFDIMREFNIFTFQKFFLRISPMKEVTLKQIAESLGISITTVSKALKDYPDVSPKTKKLVRQQAEILNYVPNSFAVNLRTKESKTIGLIIPEVVHHFFSSIVKGIIEEAEKKGYLVIILQSGESVEMEKKQIELLIQKRVDGILISLSNQTANEKNLRLIVEREIPLVLFDKISKLIHCSKVVIDDQLAAYQATEYLINSGCKYIAHIRGPLLPQNSIDRFLGYKKALEAYGIPYNSSLVYTCENVSFEEGYHFTREVLKTHPQVDGIFAVADLVAIGAIAYCNDFNIPIPDKLSIIGFSNWFMSSVITPKLTTIFQPGREMGSKSFKLLYKEIKKRKKGKIIDHKTVVLRTKLIQRESTKVVHQN